MHTQNINHIHELVAAFIIRPDSMCMYTQACTKDHLHVLCSISYHTVLESRNKIDYLVQNSGFN